MSDNIFEETEIDQLPVNDLNKEDMHHEAQRSKRFNVIDRFFLRTVNENLLSVQNLFLIHWIIYLFLYGFDQAFNTKCFYGYNGSDDMKSDLEYIHLYSKGFADFILWTAHIYMILNSFGLITAFGLKLLLMVLKLPPTSILHKLQLNIESYSLYMIFIYCTFASACSLVVAKMDMLMVDSMLVAYLSLICYFFFPATRNFVYTWLPFHWALFWFMNTLDSWDAIGVSRESMFEEWFHRLCLGKGLALTALYAAKAAEGVVTVILLLCIFRFRHYLKLAMKTSILIFLVYIGGDILLGNPDEANEHNNYLFQLAVAMVIFAIHPERRGVHIKAPYDDYDGTTIKDDWL